MRIKELYWTPGSIIVTRSEFQNEYYVIKDDDAAYPCNKELDKWWKPLNRYMYDENLDSLKEDRVRKYWDVIAAWVPVTYRRPSYGYVG